MHSTPLPNPRWRVAGALALAAACALGCVEGTDGPVITAARPDPAMPGATLRIDGVNFGAGGHVAIGGRPVPELSRSADRVEVALPADLASGPSWLVVVAEGRPSPEFPIEVGGDNPPPGEGPRVFPPGFDRGVGADGGPPPRDRGVTVDGRVDRGGDGPLVADFDPDPAGGGAVQLVARPAPDGQLVLEVDLPDAPVRGLAMHLDYDRGLLRFRSATPSGDRRLVVAEIGPGRLAIGRVVDPGARALTLTFDLVGPGEGRVDVPGRHRTARGADNRPLPGVDFAGGGLRVRRR